MGDAASTSCSHRDEQEDDVVVPDDVVGVSDDANRPCLDEQYGQPLPITQTLDLPCHSSEDGPIETRERPSCSTPQYHSSAQHSGIRARGPITPGDAQETFYIGSEMTAGSAPKTRSSSWQKAKVGITSALRFLSLRGKRGAPADGPHGLGRAMAPLGKRSSENFAVELLELALTVSSGSAADCISIAQAAVLDDHQALCQLAGLVRREGSLKNTGGSLGCSLKPRELAQAYLNGAKSMAQAPRKPEMTGKGPHGERIKVGSERSSHLCLNDAAGKEPKLSAMSDFSASSFNDFNRRSYISSQSLELAPVEAKAEKNVTDKNVTAVPSLIEFFHSVQSRIKETEAYSKPVVLEFELAGMQGIPGKCGSEVGGFPQRGGALSLARGWASESVTQGSVSAASNAMTYHSCCEAVFQTEGEEKEIVQAEVVNLPSQDGRDQGSTRLRIAFRSKCLKTQNEWQRHLLAQQRDLLKIASSRLEEAERVLQKDAEVNVEQREMLRGFRKIVTRELTHQDAQARANVYVVDKQDELRMEVEDMCGILEYPCRAFRHIKQAKMVVSGSMPLAPIISSAGESFCCETPAGPVSRTCTPVTPKSHHDISRACTPRACTPSSVASSNYVRGGPVNIVLLGSSWLDSDLPKDWNAQQDVVVVLTSRAEDFEDVGRTLLASNESEIRERLRERGIVDYLLYPLSLDSLQAVITQALRRSLGDEFLLAEVLGRGTTGVVHLAKRLRDGTAFALKEINTRRLTRTAKQDVERETKLLQECSWPTVLCVVDAWECKPDNLRYMLMPLCTGGNLLQRIEAVRGGPELMSSYKEQVAGWYSQTLHGLTYLHWRGVLHRDLKPSNILVAESDQAVQIGDLGSATLLPGYGPHPARRSAVRGAITTPNYAAAEVCMESTYMIASDIWSVGVTFYEVMTLEALCPSNLRLKEIKEFIDAFDPEDLNKSSKNMAGPALAKVRESGMDISAAELSELLRHNPLRRPTAAALAVRPATWRRLQRVLGQFWLTDDKERKSHLALFKQVTKESEEAAELEPPDTAALFVPRKRQNRRPPST